MRHRQNRPCGELDKKRAPTSPASETRPSKTGETKDKIQRSKKRVEILGGILKKVVGTSLDKGSELDALAKLPEAEREDLADRAASGEKRYLQERRKSKRKARGTATPIA